MEEAETVPGRLLIIHQGKICADGSPADIKRLCSHKGWLLIDLPRTFSENNIELPDGALLHRVESIDGGSRVYISTNTPYADMPRLHHLFPDAIRLERQEVSLADTFLAITGDRFENHDVEE
jgi:ABC-type multidrug transport system ATPase subunit